MRHQLSITWNDAGRESAEPLEGPGSERTLSDKGKLLSFFWCVLRPKVSSNHCQQHLSQSYQTESNQSSVSNWASALRWTDWDVVEGLEVSPPLLPLRLQQLSIESPWQTRAAIFFWSITPTTDTGNQTSISQRYHLCLDYKTEQEPGGQTSVCERRVQYRPTPSSPPGCQNP